MTLCSKDNPDEAASGFVGFLTDDELDLVRTTYLLDEVQERVTWKSSESERQ